MKCRQGWLWWYIDFLFPCLLAECDKLRRDGYRSSQYYSQGPTFSSSSSAICGSYQDDYEEIEQKVMMGGKVMEKMYVCCSLMACNNIIQIRWDCQKVVKMLVLLNCSGIRSSHFPCLLKITVLLMNLYKVIIWHDKDVRGRTSLVVFGEGEEIVQ